MIVHNLDTALFRGHADLEVTERGMLPHRLPSWARAQCDDAQLLSAQAQPSGVRLVFRTAAQVIELDLVRTKMNLVGVPARPDGTVDLTVDGHLVRQARTHGGDVVTVDPSTGRSTVDAGGAVTITFGDLPRRDKDVEIWLPHYERTEVVGLRSDAPIAPGLRARRTWVHHGSSISQGSNADSPSTTWPALVAAAVDLELVNLGFSGSAMLDQFTARAIRDQRADIVSVKIGINLVNSDVMRHRAFGPAVHGFLDTIRDGHPDVPLIVIGPLYCSIHETTPGPGAFDVDALAAGQLRFVATGDPVDAARPATPLDRLTLTSIRAQLDTITAQRQAEDPALVYVDGLRLYGAGDAETHPLPDNLHPDAATHRLVARRFVDATRTVMGSLPAS